MAEGLTTVIVLAVIVEILTEILKTLLPVIQGNACRYAAALIGIGLALGARVGIFEAFGMPLSSPFLDYLVTGLLISRGSNLVHDIMSRLEDRRPTPV
ncbi:MAG: hypothetical protein AB1497_06595 [Bacillota bacterium]